MLLLVLDVARAPCVTQQDHHDQQDQRVENRHGFNECATRTQRERNESATRTQLSAQPIAREGAEVSRGKLDWKTQSLLKSQPAW